MNDSETRHDEPDDEIQQLTAYLDGELDPQETAAVELRLAEDEDYRRVMQKLQQTWDVLDVLPAASSNQTFTQSTMKLVVDDARQLARARSVNRWTWPIRIMTMIAVPLILSAGTWLAARHVQDQPRRQLIDELPVARHLQLLNTDRNLSIEFLERLAAQDDLLPIAIQSEQEPRAIDFSKDGAELLASLEQLESRERKSVHGNIESYRNMQANERERLKRLREEILGHPDTGQLQQVLGAYHAWLQSLGESDAASVLDVKEPEQKVDLVRQVAEQQFYANFGRSGRTELPASDAMTVYLGFLDLIQNPSKSRMLRDAISMEDNIVISIDARSRGLENDQRKIYVAGRRLEKIYDQEPEKIDDIIDDTDLIRLKALLSQEALARIDFAINWPGNQIRSEAQLLVSWMLAVFDARFNPVTPETLQQFYDSLPNDLKDQIDNEFPEHRLRKLTEMYNQSVAG